jgi:hypothetical protein
MAHTFTFDTLKFANSLKQVGVNPAHAEKEAELIAEVIEGNLSTKYDLEVVKADLKKDMKIIEERTKTILWIVGGIYGLAVGGFSWLTFLIMHLYPIIRQ